MIRVKSRPMFGRRAAAIAAVSMVVFAGTATPQEADKGFALLPERDALIGTTTGGGLNFSSNSGGSLNYSISGPVQKREDGWVLYDLEYSSSLDTDMSTEGAALTAGIIYRSFLNDETIFGVNAYLDVGRRSELEEVMGLASFGVEYEKRPEDWEGGFLQAGGNFYIPFDDYTNLAAYGELSSAPRIGVDGYASFGRSFDGYSWLGSLYVLNYFETDTAFDLTGYAAEGAVEWTRGLPSGWTGTASLGVQDDSRIGQETSLYAGLALDYTFGGSNGDVLPARDCALVRAEDGSTTVDCAESVIPNTSGTLLAKDGTVVNSTAVMRTARVVPPRRHVAFGTPFTPIEYKPQTATLQIEKLTADDADNTFNFASDVAELSTDITTNGGSGTSVAVEVDAGTYTISEINLPLGYSLDSVTCSGATSFVPSNSSDGVSVTVDAGQEAICTFTNEYTAPAPATVTFILDTQWGGRGTNPHTVVTDVPGIQTVYGLNVGAGPTTSPTVTVDAGIYSVSMGNILYSPSLLLWNSASCTGVQSQTPITDGVTFTVAPGDNAVCTLESTFEPATITLLVEAVGGDDTFTFSTDIPGLPTSITTSGGLTNPFPVTVPAGTRYIIEQVNLPSGWALVSQANNGMGCSGSSIIFNYNDAGRMSIANSIPGANIVCTFRNEYVGP